MAARPGRDKRLYLIDGMPLVYRAYFVFLNNPLITSTGFNSSAVFGYTTSLLQILNDEEPTHVAVVFDAPGPTRRNREYADYKSTRQKAPEDIRDSLPHVRRVTEAMGISIITHEGVEADDVIGTLTRQAEAAGFDTYMVSLDKDLAQLVSEHTFLYRVPRMGGDPPVVLDVAAVCERFGVQRTEQVIDLLGLAGDSTDNIPGVPGVGEKTAQKLLAQFGTVEGLVAGVGQLKGKQREKIETYAAQALLSKSLATIDRDLELDVDPDTFATAALDPERVIPLFQEFEFAALINRVFGDAAAAAAATPAAGASRARATATATPSSASTTVSSAVSSAATPATVTGAATGAASGATGLEAVTGAATGAASGTTGLEAVPGAATGAAGGTTGLEAVTGAATGAASGTTGLEAVTGAATGAASGTTGLEAVTGAATGAASGTTGLEAVPGPAAPPLGTPDHPERPASLANTAHDYRPVDGAAERAALRDALRRQQAVSLYVASEAGDPKTAPLTGVAFSWEPGSARYLPLPPDRAAAAARLRELAPFWEDPSITKIGHDLKRWVTALRWHGIAVAGTLLDTRLAHQLIESEGAHDLALLAEHYLHYAPAASAESLAGSPPAVAAGKAAAPGTPATPGTRELALYAGERADLTARLLDALQHEIDRLEESEVWQRIEVPLLPLLVEMEYAGVAVRVDVLRDYSIQLENEIANHEADLYRLAGGEFNLNSPKQLGELLFEQFKISDKPRRTRTGQYSTTEQELTRLADRHPIIPAILEYRVVQKLKSTYVDALPAAVSPETGRIHTTFNQLVAATGRLNSENPNLQNIPIRTDKGREIRRAFVAPAGDHVLLSADYSQIELRIMAAITEDPGLVEAFAGDVDIHAATSARVFGVPLTEVSAEMRRRAKMINFGLMYGMSAFGLAQRLNIGRAEAREIIDRYFEQFPRIKQYMGDTVLFAREHSYVQTLRGRRRYLRDILSRNYAARAAAERVAINAPIQGSAADMIKLAMLDIQRELDRRAAAARMILQVHDELVFEVPRAQLAEVSAVVTAGMRDAMPLGRVPVVVDVGVGDNWLEAH